MANHPERVSIARGFRIGKKHWKKWALAALAVSAFAVWLLLRGRPSFDWALFGATIRRLHASWVALSLAFILASYYGRALRWSVMMRPVKAHPSHWNLFSATVVGFTAVTLLGRPGEFVRPYLISAKEQVPLSSQFAAWILERIYDLLAVLALFGFALSRVRHSGATVGPALAWVFSVGGWFVAVCSSAVLILLVLFRTFSGSMGNRLLGALRFLPEHLYRKAEPLVESFVRGVEGTRSASALLLILFYTALEWVIIVGSVYCVLRAFSGISQFGVIDVLIYLGFASFGTLVQIPGVGGGMQVVSVVIFRELFGLPLEVATSMALVVWIVTFVAVVPIGLALGLHDGLKWNKLKGIGREVGA